MKVVGLMSGGKDSCFNLCHCVAQGHEIVALATLAPPEGKDECDSYMFQTVGHDAVHLVAEAMGLPLYRGVIAGDADSQGEVYGSRLPSLATTSSEQEDETHDLFLLLQNVKRHHPEIDAVSAGAISSNYQRQRIEHVASHPSLRLTPLTYLWQRSQESLLIEMEQSGLDAVLVKVAGIGLEEKDLGRTLRQMRPRFKKLNQLYGSYMAGEGGEYETLTIDCPLFHQRIELAKTAAVLHSDSSFASVAYLQIKEGVLKEKQDQVHASAIRERVTAPPRLDQLGRHTKKRIVNAKASCMAAAAPRPAESNPYEASLQRQASRTRGRWLGISNVTASEDTLGALDLSAEAEAAFAALRTQLSSQNLTFAHLSHINLYLTSQADFGAINIVYARQFGAAPPSRACVALAPQSTRAGHGPRLRMDAVAFDDGSRYDGAVVCKAAEVRARKSLHVQGRSYWAPANIGPYSQAVTTASRISIAGQIGLLPADLSLPASPADQVALSLQHARRIFKAVQEGRMEKGRGWIEGGICWLQSPLDQDAAGEIDGLLSMADAAWRAQSDSPADDEDEDAEEEVESDWLHVPWLGSRHFSSAKGPPPILYASLEHGALPRGAVIEWQLNGHTGRSARSISGLLPARKQGGSAEDDEEEDDEDNDGEAGPPLMQAGECSLPGALSCTWRSVTSRVGASSFGLAALRMSAGDDVLHLSALALHDSASPNSTSAQLSRALDCALTLRVFHTSSAALQWALDALAVIAPAARESCSTIPCSALHTSFSAGEQPLIECEACFVWEGMGDA